MPTALLRSTNNQPSGMRFQTGPSPFRLATATFSLFRNPKDAQDPPRDCLFQASLYQYPIGGGTTADPPPANALVVRSANVSAAGRWQVINEVIELANSVR